MVVAIKNKVVKVDKIIHNQVKLADSYMVVLLIEQVEQHLQQMILLHIQVQVLADTTAVAVVLLVHHNLILYQQDLQVQVEVVHLITDIHK